MQSNLQSPRRKPGSHLQFLYIFVERIEKCVYILEVFVDERGEYISHKCVEANVCFLFLFLFFMLVTQEEIEIEAKVLKVGTLIDVISVDFREKNTRKLIAQGCHSMYIVGPSSKL